MRLTQIVLAVALWAPVLDASATPILIGIGHVPRRDFSSVATDVSSDGTVVVGYSSGYSFGTGTGEAFRWDADAGMIGLGDLPGGAVDSAALAVSADGTVVVGYSSDPSGYKATRWTQSEGLVELPGEEARGVSADGSAIAGSFAYSIGAYQWTEESGVELIGAGTAAWGMSGDGSTVVGGSSVGPYKWTAEKGLVQLGALPGSGKVSRAFSVSYDGSVVVGESNGQAFRWTAETGMVGLGQLVGRTSALAVSADGDVVVGWDLGETLQAFIWDAEHGMRALRDVLTEQGLDLSGWELWEAQAISDDGHAIVGSGRNPSGQLEAWLVHLPEPSTSLLLAVGVLGLAAVRSLRAARP